MDQVNAVHVILNRPVFLCLQPFHPQHDYGLYQATLIGGGGGILTYPPQKNLPKIPPLKFWEIF